MSTKTEEQKLVDFFRSAAGYETDESLARIADAYKESLKVPADMPTIIDTRSDKPVRKQ